MAKVRKKTALIWNGDIQDALAFFELKCPDIELRLLISPLKKGGEHWNRPLPSSLLEAQALSLELPILFYEVEKDGNLWDWDESFSNHLLKEGIEVLTAASFEAEPLLEARAKQMGLKTKWPMKEWNLSLCRNAFFSMGHQAIIIEAKDPALVGSLVTSKLFDQFKTQKKLPFESFVFEGPFFQKKISVGVEDTESGKKLQLKRHPDLKDPKDN
jgi:diphthamide synthase (EF-2-diphthine--ammonia ligase)